MNAATSATPETSEVEFQVTKGKPLPQGPEDYNSRSTVAKAYRAGFLPISHRILFEGIRQELQKNGGNGESGDILLKNVLLISGLHRNSALTMLNHLKNFGIIEAEPISHNVDWRIKILKTPDSMGKVTGVEQFAPVPVVENMKKEQAQDASEAIAEDNLPKQVKRFNNMSNNAKAAEIASPSQNKKEEVEPQAKVSDKEATPVQESSTPVTSVTTPVKAGKVEPLDSLREEAAKLMGPEPDGLGLRTDEQEKTLIRFTGKKNLADVQVSGGLQRLINSLKAELAKRIEEAR